MVTTGNEPALPDLAPSTNASSPDVRGGCMAMAQDPVAENAVRLARAFRISHGISGWLQLSENPLSTIGCLQPPGLRQPRLSQPRLRGWPRPCYSCRCLSSTRTGLAAVEHPCRPSLTSLTTSSVSSFISCVSQLAI